jgi:osmotically-inducible protein OsmY
VNRWLALSLALVLCSGCASIQQKVPEPFGTRAAGDVLHDGLILAEVKAKLTEQDPDSTTTLGVSVHEGVVTLSGTTRDKAHLRRDVAAAKHVHGVVALVDHLRVDGKGPRPGLDLSEAATATRIVAAYTAEVGFQRVQVRVDRGVVTLSGPVASDQTRDAIIAAARATHGVRKVISRMNVSHS